MSSKRQIWTHTQLDEEKDWIGIYSEFMWWDFCLRD